MTCDPFPGYWQIKPLLGDQVQSFELLSHQFQLGLNKLQNAVDISNRTFLSFLGGKGTLLLIKGGKFLKKRCGAASVGKNNKVLRYYQMS